MQIILAPKLVLTALKTTFSKNKPKELFYQDYKKFNFSDFNDELKTIFSRNTVGSCYQFDQIFLNVLDKHAPMKRKLLRASHSSYISKPLRKAIMRRSHIEKVYYKNKSEKSFKAYKKQKNFCSRLYKKESKRFFNNLNPSFVTDNKLFWKTIKPFFSNKGNYGSQIKRVEKDEVLQDDDLIAKELNKFFKNAVSTLNVKENRFITSRSSDGITDPVDKTIDKYKFHPSIILIQKHLKNHVFSFKTVEIGDIEKEINNIFPKKATTSNSIPSKILKKSSKVSASVRHKLFNDSTDTSGFPQNLKLADTTPVYKKNEPSDKTNYRPVSILPVVSKMFERIMQKQINDFIISFLSPYLCGYRKGFNTQHALLTLVEKWRKSLDNKGFAGAILMDLSKAFDTLNQDLLIAKQHDALKLLQNYLSKRWHRTKVNTSFSSWEELIKGVPQGSVLGPILFNLYLNDLFYLPDFTEACNFADDTFHVCDNDLNNLIKRVEHNAFLAIEWFETNNMKLNKDKCHLLVSGHKYENVWVKMGDEKNLGKCKIKINWNGNRKKS